MTPVQANRNATKRRVVKRWSITKNIPLKQAREEFEKTKTFAILMSPQTKFWKESAAYICEKWEYELEGNWEMWMR